MKKSSLTDVENLQKDVDALSKTLKLLSDSQFSLKITDLTNKHLKLEESLKNLINKLQDENSVEEIEGLKSAIDELKYEIEKKADKSLIADVYSKAAEPKHEQVQEKYDFNEF